MKSDTALTRDCAVNSACSKARLIARRCLTLLVDAGQKPVQFGVGLRESGERTERIVRAVGLGVVDGFDRGVARRIELIGLGRVGLPQLSGGRVDSVLDVGDRRGQPVDRMVDVGGCAVDGVEQRLRLAQRALRSADRVDQRSLVGRGPAHQVAA